VIEGTGLSFEGAEAMRHELLALRERLDRAAGT
jgi:hypothetical protein